MLLDLNMPHVTGFDVLQSVRGTPALRHTPVVVLTSSTDAPNKLRALEYGATDFLAKPVDESEFMLRLRNILIARAFQHQLAYIDGVTGLPNKQLFQHKVDRALERHLELKKRCAMLHIDLTRFRRVNDAHGPACGDQLLADFASRLFTLSRDSDVVGHQLPDSYRSNICRFGSDTFCLLVTDIESPDDVAQVARRMIDANNAEPFQVAGDKHFQRCRIGIAVFPDDGVTGQDLVSKAEVATYHAKSNPGDHAIGFYSNEMNTATREKLQIEDGLSHAIERNELYLAYQPKVCVKTNKTVGAEALMRWNHPKMGAIPPGKFIEVAEETGSIIEIGIWAVERVCEFLGHIESRVPGLQIAVNMSIKQLHSKDFVESLQDILDRHGTDPARIKLEITESLMMDSLEDSQALLNCLKEIGFELSIDDFGTGHSSLQYLRVLPFDEIKIDRSFVNELTDENSKAPVINAIASLSRDFGFTLVAEGVETETQLKHVKHIGCDIVQGYYFSRPLAGADFLEYCETPINR
ncbi:MAG: EAL domain-containing protein [Pseudomonadota bacterium]